MVDPLIEDKKVRRLTYKRRMGNIKKKTWELATLCGIDACTVCFGIDGEVETWPEDSTDLRAVLKRYRDHYKTKSSETEESERTAAADDAALSEKIEKLEREIDAAKRENSRKMEQLTRISKSMQAELDVLNERIVFFNRCGEPMSSDLLH